MATHQESTSLTDPASGAHVAHETPNLLKKVGIPFLFLLGFTIIEFIVALAIPQLSKYPWKAIIYVGLTIAKAYYIVMFFMHLRYERANMIYSIVVPVFFIVVLILALMFEGSRLAY